jgi:hypothetical protein
MMLPSVADDVTQTRLAALQSANEVRRVRAQLKRHITEGSLSAAEVLLDPPAPADSWPVAELLLSQRGWGRVKCRKFLVANQISEAKPIGDLTARQRSVLAAQLPLVSGPAAHAG